MKPKFLSFVLAALAVPFLIWSHSTAAQAGACRTYSIRQVGQMTSSNGMMTGRTEQNCTPYNRSTNSVRCTLTHTGGTGNLTQTVTGYFKSVSDFVDEVRVVPPLMRMTRQEMGAQPAQSTLDIFYDGQGRPARSVLTSSTGVQNSQFAGWDKEGRYTDVTISSAMAPTERVTYSYDDAARTMTITNKRIGFTGVYTHDENGILIKSVTTDASGQRTLVVTIGSTDKICK